MSGILLMLDNGPCMGSYDVTRAPKTLRAVRSSTGQRDVLNLPEDAPAADEDVHVYTRDDRAAGHLCTRGRGCYTTLSYRYVGALDKTTGEITLVDEADAAWWEEQRMAALRAWAVGERYAVPAARPAQGTTLL